MGKIAKKYYVQWIETHVAEVMAGSEKEALKSAQKIPGRQTLETTENPIVIAA